MGSNPTSATHMLPTTKLWIALKRLCGRTVHHSGPPEVGGRVRPDGILPRARAHLKSLVMVALKASEEVYRLLIARSTLRRGRHVIMDRHPWADYHMSYAGTGEHWLRVGDRLHKRLIERVYPPPDTIILLDAPAEVLYGRKPEGSLEALRVRRRQYLRAVRAVPPGVEVVVIDVARPMDEVFEDLRRMVRPTHSQRVSAGRDREPEQRGDIATAGGTER